MAETTRHELLIGLHVEDEASYARYRAGMTPLLEAVGGFFRYDWTIAAQLKGAADPPINRLFLISFPDEATKEAFFADPAYLAVRAEHFQGAVASVERLAEYAHAG